MQKQIECMGNIQIERCHYKITPLIGWAYENGRQNRIASHT